ncbi:hypothetical protein PPYR_02902 [Photinus pyralis]|uniref:Uncharacterized protein n=3 Tax=Photinus pyralis TaxID=7054 RepID=A0A5N4A198_PHOPY|nr:protein NEDD1-like [Photinus pyralis]XP_031331419.1 protein NEDD1-like [Photinus pyralis]KAB0791102.1 hypothetical protein PPYR_02902 [Photinus pyralis]
MFVTAGVDLKFHEIGDTCLFAHQPFSFGNITSVSWSNDNGFITTLSENGVPEVISLKEPKHVKTVHVVTAVKDVSVASFQRTTKRFMGLGTYSGRCVLYDTKSKAIHQQFPDVPGAINLLDFNYGDRQMAVSSLGGNLFLFDVNNANVLKTYATPDVVSAMRFHPRDRNLLLCGLENGTLMQWDIDVGKSVHCNQLHSAAVSGLALTNGSGTYISVGYDNKFCIYDTNSGTCTFRSNQRHPLTSVDAHVEDNAVAIGTLFGNLYTYDVRNLIAPSASETPHNSKINRIAFENNKKLDVLLKGAAPESSISLQPEIKFMNYNLDAHVDANLPCCDAAREIKQVDGRRESPNALLKKEVADAVRTCAEELQAQIAKQMENLQAFILEEFKTVCDGIEKKWDDICGEFCESKGIQ